MGDYIRHMIVSQLVGRAVKESGFIAPCVGKETFDDCFTVWTSSKKNRTMVYFWYNDASHTTKITHSEYPLEDYQTIAEVMA